MSITACVNGTIQFNFFLVMTLNNYHCHELWLAYWNTCKLIFTSLKFENGLNVAEIKNRFFKLVFIFFTFNTRCDYVIPKFTLSKIVIFPWSFRYMSKGLFKWYKWLKAFIKPFEAP